MVVGTSSHGPVSTSRCCVGKTCILGNLVNILPWFARKGITKTSLFI